jgi:hypothetical protein
MNDYVYPAQYPQNTYSSSSMFFWFILYVICLVGIWKIFVKAGEKGWKSLIPIYNTIVLLKIIGKPWWWILLFFIPFVNIVIWIIMDLELAKVFGKSALFGVGLIFFPFIFMLILGFGSAQYSNKTVPVQQPTTV